MIRRVDAAEDRARRCAACSAPARRGSESSGLAGYVALRLAQRRASVPLPFSVLIVPLALPHFPASRAPDAGPRDRGDRRPWTSSLRLHFCDQISKDRSVACRVFVDPVVDGEPSAVPEIRHPVAAATTRFDATDAGFLDVDGELAETLAVS